MFASTVRHTKTLALVATEAAGRAQATRDSHSQTVLGMLASLSIRSTCLGDKGAQRRTSSAPPVMYYKAIKPRAIFVDITMLKASSAVVNSCGQHSVTARLSD